MNKKTKQNKTIERKKKNTTDITRFRERASLLDDFKAYEGRKYKLLASPRDYRNGT